MSFHDTYMLWVVIALSIIAAIILTVVVLLFMRKREQKGIDDKIKLEEALKSLQPQKEIKLSKKQEADLIKNKEQELEQELEQKFKDRPFQELKSFEYFKRKRGTWRKLKENWLNRKRPQNILLINMELNNGFHTLFLAYIKEGMFRYKKGKYVIDETKNYYIADLKIYAADYHESFTQPIERKLPVADMKKQLEQVNASEIEYATNPATLQRVLLSKVAEGVMKGQALDDWLRQVRLIVIIILLVAGAHFLYILVKTGAFQQVQSLV